MIVCHCRAISDRTIRASIREGATSLDAVSSETGASTCCGGCEPTVAQILDEELGSGRGAGCSADSSIRPRAFRPLRVVRAA